MSRPEGTPKTGGRIKGTPNRPTFNLLSRLSESNCDVVQQLLETLPLLDPPQKAKVLLSMMDFIYPKRKAAETKFESEQSVDADPEEVSKYVLMLKECHERDIEMAREKWRIKGAPD